MKTLKLLILCILAYGLLACTPAANNDSTDTEVVSDWTATTEVKTKTVEMDALPHIIYQDFTFRYDFAFTSGPILAPCKRSGNEFSKKEWYSAVFSVESKYEKAGVVSLGPVNGLSSITSKDTNVQGQKCHWGDGYLSYYGENFVPHSGYYMYYLKESGDLAFVRLYVSDYTLDSEGTVTSVTIQYQLY